MQQYFLDFWAEKTVCYPCAFLWDLLVLSPMHMGETVKKVNMYIHCSKMICSLGKGSGLITRLLMFCAWSEVDFL